MMDTIILVVLVAPYVLCGIFYWLWRKEYGIRKQMRQKVSYVDFERFHRAIAEWRYDRLKEAIRVECQEGPKILARLELRIKWIENPPPIQLPERRQ